MAYTFTLTAGEDEVRPISVDYDIEEIRNRYLKLSTPFASDVLFAMGLPSQAMDTGIYPLKDDMKVAGPAFTSSRYRGTIAKSIDKKHIDLIPSLTPGCVFISDDGGDRACAHMGDILCMLYQSRGCTGAVLDWAARDTGTIAEMGFPMFCRGKNPTAGHERSVVIDYNVPIFVHGVDGMLRVNPGDFIFGDSDGVVIIPKDKTVEVLEKMEAMAAIEVEMRAAVNGGMDAVEAFRKFRRS